MNISDQRWSVRLVSLGVTGLLLGTLAGGSVMYLKGRRQLEDPEFLKQRLEQLDAAADTGPAARPPALVRVSLARRKPIQPQRAIVGRLVEVHRLTVAAEVTGKIKELPLEEGTPVVGGTTVLAEIDDIWSRLAERRCRAQIASTTAKLKYEQAELDRQKRLSEKRVTSDSELESKQAEVDQLNAMLEECNARLEEESERSLRCKILAPFDGTVVLKHAEVGQHVAPGTPIVDLVSRGAIDARIMVPESVINFVRVDQLMPIRVDALAEEVPGKVVSLTPYGLTASRTFPVRVRLDDGQGRLKAGMSVTAIIATGPRREALVVGKDAVLVRPDGSTVWVASGDSPGTTVQPVPVTISVRTPDEYAIEPETAEGAARLVAGAQVVIEGAERLMPGQEVRVITLPGAPEAGGGDDEAAPATPTAAGDSRPSASGRQEG